MGIEETAAIFNSHESLAHFHQLLGSRQTYNTQSQSCGAKYRAQKVDHFQCPQTE